MKKYLESLKLSKESRVVLAPLVVSDKLRMDIDSAVAKLVVSHPEYADFIKSAGRSNESLKSVKQIV